MSENVHIQDKLADIQRKMNVPKSQYNKFGNYNYRNAEDILSEFKKYSSEYGLCLTINDEVLEIGGRIYVRATATLKSGAESISNGDCIINVGKGVFRPIPSDPVDEAAFHEYIAKDLHRARAIQLKRLCMKQTYDSWSRCSEVSK